MTFWPKVAKLRSRIGGRGRWAGILDTYNGWHTPPYKPESLPSFLSHSSLLSRDRTVIAVA